LGFKKGFQEPPHFGIFASGTVFCAVVRIWVSTAIENPDSIGFHVRLFSPIAQKEAFDPWLQPIVIRVDGAGRYYLNGDAIPARRIPARLTRFFQKRANRIVYVEGDLDSSFGNVVEAADAVRSAGGRVVLLTPKRP
jgi:biopolymer transport protein ExbD